MRTFIGLTPEDAAIWLDMDEAVPGRRYDLVSEICAESDQIDFYIILMCVTARRETTPYRVPLRVDDIDCGGAWNVSSRLTPAPF